ncbi:SNF2 helicase associated domain-containing protein [Paenarthrobacter sp. Z7-10]|uniref:DEAD/DEAH box helicase n=1 Tax=Paenarthrobacter sp. Z7-10 TaxID=2787635 RepID=UPI0022A8DA00|nr:DEAD/DEAH box helicase [Paenarthrobacter sp. Z7-10]MCZ2401853.1 SNF2 helicase associated domain-containing protein [Paenarthrobacter sp. Z7-10]
MTFSPAHQSRLVTSTPHISDRSTVAGFDYAGQGRVKDIAFESGTGLLRGQVRGTSLYHATAKLIQSVDGRWSCSVGICSCPVRQNCKHVAALLFAAESDPDIGPLLGTMEPVSSSRATTLTAVQGRSSAQDEATADWEKTLMGLLPSSRSTRQDSPPLALQFELERPVRRFSYRGHQDTKGSPVQLNVRPVLLGAKGKWVRSGIGWNTLNYLNFGRKFNEAHLDWLLEFLNSHSPSSRQVSSGSPWLALNSFAGRNLWNLLAEAGRIGLSLVHSRGSMDPVRVLDEPAKVRLSLSRAGSGALDLGASAEIGGVPVAAEQLETIGRPAHGLFYADNGPDPLPELHPQPGNATAVPGVITLAPLETPLSEQLLGFIHSGSSVQIPARDEDRFLRKFYPQLQRTAEVVSIDGSVELPAYSAPVLSLLANYDGDHRVRLHWEWHYSAGDRIDAEPLWGRPDDSGYRDEAAEARILQSVGQPWETVAPLGGPGEHSWAEPRLLAAATLEGLDTLTFTEQVLPALRELPEVLVETAGEVADYREVTEAPVVSISTAETADRDWFDLGIVITLEGEPVSFAAVFSALAAGSTRMLLPSGAHFSLERPELHQLRELIDEARVLQDAGSEGLKISRFQASLWDELAQLGIVDQQAAAWRSSVAGLLSGSAPTPLPAPDSLNAVLRPYQLEGFNWLNFLFSHDLGGVLADDMGLGKTVQTLALVCSAKERNAETQNRAPFLVVAPTSVVGNWETEAARFAPGLRTLAITETFAKSGLNPADVVGGADIVITSYALFRIDFEAYAAHSWAGLILDEAQFVKNHQSKAYQCARKLPAPFKLAVTGTPLENNLMELWTLTSIVAPGLFPSPKRFAEFYQKPIEKDGNADQLAKLRARVRPLMLRRTKEQVIRDLPPKQEQVLEVVLNPRHSKVYQTHLQRERQKVLGLLEDVNKNRFTIFQSLTLLRQLSLDASLVDESLSAVRSSKLDVLFEQLEDVIAEGHRALIFSQFTGFLGKVRDRLTAEGIEFCYLDGSTRKRSEVVRQFKEGTAPLFLISLKAGGFGLNLTEADYVFILDPWWNPASEAQAVDRTHRIGQAKNVMVYRMVAKDTIEEKVMALKAKKSRLFADVMSGESLPGGALTAADLAGLFSD